MKKIVILTGSELRHTFLKKAIALNQNIEVLRSYCEGTERQLASVIDTKNDQADRQIQHVESRARSEDDFFGPFVRLASDESNSKNIEKGKINDPVVQEEIRKLSPDLLIAYGCSIVREPLISDFKGRFLNVHLGLSPYYRGSGTNFWALVNNEPEYCGATFMYMDAGVDTGRVIHQIRARVFAGDTPHQIGNRLIADMADVYTRIINNFERLVEVGQLSVTSDKYYRQKDFSPESVVRLYQNFAGGLVDRYVERCKRGEELPPIIRNPGL
jgi:methionyl-tRNA formyltransferase